jgi:hypothetical protein
MQKRIYSLILVFVFILGGCSTAVKRPAGYEDQPKPVVKALSNFNVTLSENAKSQLPDNAKFNKNELHSTLERTLESLDLLAPDGSFTMNVVVDDIRVRSNFSAVMWGFMAGDDHLQGDVSILNEHGESVYEFRPEISYALGGFAGGMDSARMSYLYEEFAEVVAKELEIKKAESANN